MLIYIFQVAGGLHPVNLIALSLSCGLFTVTENICVLICNMEIVVVYIALVSQSVTPLFKCILLEVTLLDYSVI